MTKYPHQQLAFAIVTGGPLLAMCFVALRIYARRWSRVALDWSDYSVILASIFSVALIYPSYRNIQMWHYGIHIWNVDQRHLEPDFHEYYRIQLAIYELNAPIVPLVKASIILLLMRVGWVIAPVRKALFVLLLFVLSFCVGTMIAFAFICPPRTGGTWTPTTFNGLRCIGLLRTGLLNVIIVTVNMVTDIFILPIPFILMKELRRTSLRAQATIVLLFVLSLGAGIIGAVRLKLQWKNLLFHESVSDWTYTISYALGQAENSTAISLACIPPLRGLILRWSSRGIEEVHRIPGQTDFANDRIPGEHLLYDSASDLEPSPTQSDEKSPGRLEMGRIDSTDAIHDTRLRAPQAAFLRD